MDLTSISDEGVSSYIASRIRAERQRLGFSQSLMAKKSGIPLRTYKRIELTGFGSIQNLILILRTFERLTAIKLLFPMTETTRRLTIVERVQRMADEKLIESN
jgi:transcriptional regulator with XRE-family HTH domain